MKRTLRFIKDRRQKRALYLALTRSLFARLTNVVLINQVKNIQRREIKWILGEQDHYINDIEYLAGLRELELMPMELKFEYTDLILFH